MNDNLIETATSSYATGSWELLEGTQYHFTYNASQKPIEVIVKVYDYQIQTWINVEKTETIYDGNGLPIEVISYSFDNNSLLWTPETKTTNISWHNAALELPDTMVIQMDLGFGWMDMMRYVFTYDNTGHIPYTYVQMMGMGSWENYLKIRDLMDQFQNPVFNTMEIFDGSSWSLMYGDRNTYTYDPANRKKEQWTTYYNESTMTWDSALYIQYFYQSSTGITTKNHLDKWNVFPNPFQDRLTISGELVEAGAEINVYDISGRMVYAEKVNAESNILDLSHLISGAYFVQIKEGSEVKAIKIIKQ